MGKVWPKLWFVCVAIAWFGRLLRRLLKWSVVAVLCLVGFVVLSNLILFATDRDIPARALANGSASCADALGGWNVLAQKGNDEWSVIDADTRWSRKFACAIQRHVVPPAVGQADQAPLSYDLAFIEFQEDGKPYALRTECADGESCAVEKTVPVRQQPRGQLEALLQHLEHDPGPHYVIAFVHGWRHDASIGDSDVQKMRVYAAHAARFVADRAKIDDVYKGMRVTAVYVGWRGARTDETWLTRNVPWFGETIGTVSAVFTLFDRKPVSEAIAPSALSALRAIENRLQIDAYTELPRKWRHKMLVLGHSLGGNMLMTALEDHLVKKAIAHTPSSYMHPVLGDLVVLINPASEASKWTAVQRAVWRRIATLYGERRPGTDFEASHVFFHPDQRPVFISVTAARNWPPGGRLQIDCGLGGAIQSRVNARVQRFVDYDWATHDLFPAFKGDLRPLADRIEQWSTQTDPDDECARPGKSLRQRLLNPLRAPALLFSDFVRVLPFMQTDPEQTRTIGHLDPPRAPLGNVRTYKATMRPFGTTHELRASAAEGQQVVRRMSEETSPKELPLPYGDIGGTAATCPMAEAWLSRVRAERIRREVVSGKGNYPRYAVNWDTDDLPHGVGAKEGYPALRFVHGFELGGIAPPTRENDPFWNLRAFDTALARHDGFMLSSFICAMNQLVLDDVTTITPPAPRPVSTTTPPRPG